MAIAKRKHAKASGKLQTVNERTAVVTFLILLIVTIFVLDSMADQKAIQAGTKPTINRESISKELADQLVSKLTINSKDQDGVAFIVQDKVDPELLEHFTSKSYEQLKKELGIELDFVVHFEDDEGNIVPMGNKMCVGSGGATINGKPCT